ncbi:hypothetical protein BC828DRAFT_378182 [Blastocladiella britannica]|nr:hypothetical protein BC828DRAFT_378182 [Blastocladiella britannica]
MHFATLLLIAAIATTAQAAHVNQVCGNGLPACSWGQCCSKWGYCGTTQEFCASNTCQPQYSAPGACAPGSGGVCGPNAPPCPGNQCCSRWGYCGTTDAFCGAGCQPEYSHYCYDSRPTTTSWTVTPTTSWAPTPTTVSPGECGPGHPRCPTGKCCSKYGYCGTTADFCAPGSCQPDWSGGLNVCWH